MDEKTLDRLQKFFADRGFDGCETTLYGGDIAACVGNCPCRDEARAVLDLIDGMVS